MLSRVLGLVRDILMASLFGTSMPMSAFVVAFTIPNLFRRLFGEGALSAAFVPVYMATRHQEGDVAAWAVARHILTILTIFLSGVALAGIGGITWYMGRPDLGAQTALTLSLLRIMLPYMIFICVAALYMALLNAHHHFSTPALAPSLLNVVWVLTVWLLCPLLGDRPEIQIFGVAWAVLLAGILQWGIQIPKLIQFGFSPGWSTGWRDRHVRRIFRLMGPASLGMAITQINVVIDRFMAAWIGVWAPAALFFSERLIYLPQGIFATALSTVLLPVFSGHAARSDHRRILDMINFSLRNLLYVMIPAAIGLLTLARPIVELLFERAAFGSVSTGYTTTALMCYAPGLLVFSLGKVFVPAFYALQDTRTPVKVAACTVLLKIGLSLCFITFWPLHLKHGGLALATVMAETVNGAVLGLLLHRRLGSPGWRVIGGSAWRCLVAAVLMAAVARHVQSGLSGILPPLDLPVKLAQLISVFSAIGAGMLTYLLITWVLRSPEIHDVGAALRRRFLRG